MQKKSGISLIVLVITIIVMIILAAAVVISLNNSGIIGKAQDAVKLTNEQEAKTILSTAILEYDLEKSKNSSLTLADYLRSKSWCKSVTEDEGTLIVEIEQGKYDITADREIRVHDETVAKLKEKYQMAYYTSFGSAVTDVNSGVTTNGTATESTAVAGVYTDEQGIMNIVLLKSTTEEAEIDVTNNTNINLGGRVLTFEKVGFLNFDGTNINVSIDGTVAGSKIKVQNLTNPSADYFMLQEKTKGLRINGGTYEIIGNNLPKTVITVNSKRNVIINDAKIVINGKFSEQYVESESPVIGIQFTSKSENNIINNCDIDIEFDNGKYALGINNSSKSTEIKNTNINVNTTNTVESVGVRNNINSNIKLENTNILIDSKNNLADGVLNYGIIEITNTKVFADATEADGTSGKYSVGIGNGGTLTFNSGSVFGTHSGMSCNADSKTYVYGGEFSSASHGGIYFCHGANGEAYVENTVLKRLTESEYKGKHNYTAISDDARGSIYIGGGTAANNSNMSVYMDNCTFVGGPIVLRGSDNETGNKLYISNSTSSAGVRIDNDNLKIYSGVGNTLNVSSAYSSRVETTSVSYKRAN